MELGLNLSNLGSSISEKVSELQEKFLNSTFGKAVDNALDVGLQIVLPDAIEDEVIEIKDAFLEEGISEGISQTVETVKDFAKSTLGIITGNFESISQVRNATDKGGVLDTISSLLDKAITGLKDKGVISSSVAKSIKSVKKEIINTASDNISETLDDQIGYTEKLEKYINSWKEAYETQDFDDMKKAYKQIEKYLEKTMLTENLFKDARIIENLHNLIANNGEIFDLTEEELGLAEKLY